MPRPDEGATGGASAATPLRLAADRPRPGLWSPVIVPSPASGTGCEVSMSVYREVPNSVRFPDLELEVLERWRRERTFERSVEQRAGAPTFVFYDGPPFATGLPHYGHILTSFIKDVVPRYQTMRGRHVPRRWGWDCHGLPVEHEVEKALGLGSRADIVRHGLARFNDACRALVMRYEKEWEAVIHRLG